jgi:hypothetical protein
MFLAAFSAFGWLQADRQADELSARLAEIEAAPPSGAVAPTGDSTSLRERLARLEGDMKRLVGLSQENEKQLNTAQEQVAALEEENKALSSPRGTLMMDLGSGDVVRGEEAETTIEADQHVTLLLSVRGYRESGPPRAEITDNAGKVVQVNGLPMTQEGYVSIALSPGFLPPGLYTLRISGLTNHRWTFEVVP